jgi:hypothetical protein
MLPQQQQLSPIVEESFENISREDESKTYGNSDGVCPSGSEKLNSFRKIKIKINKNLFFCFFSFKLILFVAQQY